ncbi:MAG: glycosyltransferase family 2 protein [Bacteroidales bacterium]
MKISGFTMSKNAEKLGYPVKESILSALPLVDEFVVALGDSDPDDHSRQLINEIKSDKIKIVDTVWDIEKYPKGMEHAHQTDIAKNHCSGDWLLYLQADELIHEKDIPAIRQRCNDLLNDQEVEGLLFKYYHFWGDFKHYHFSHSWYKHEIRIIRNDPEIHSWESAQSFRRIPDFDGLNYRVQENTFKLNVASVDAHIYHYGWVRPPHIMKKKLVSFATNHRGQKGAAKMEKTNFDYGNIKKIRKFKGEHPKVMKDKIANYNWENKLYKRNKNRPKFKHEKFKYKLLTFIENYILHQTIFTFKNYNLLKK